jgi:hypothetical protein
VRGVAVAEQDWERSEELARARQLSWDELLHCWNALQRTNALIHAIPV